MCKNSSVEPSLQSTTAENVKGTDLFHCCSGGWTPIFQCNFCVQQPDYSHLSDVRVHTKISPPLFFILHEYLGHTKPERITKSWTSLLETDKPKVSNTDRCTDRKTELKHRRCGYERYHPNTNWWLYIHTHKYVHTHPHTDKAPENKIALIMRSTLGECQAHKQ